jgi:heptaprenyl diphosphate synthase
VALLFGNAMTLAYSLAGAILSLMVMTLLKRLDLFSAVGVSILGGVAHNLGQILVAIVLLNSTLIGYYMIILTITGTLAGVFVGLVGSLLVKRLQNIKI